LDTGLQTFFAPCPRGLEGLLCTELAALGAGDVARKPGGAAFTGPFTLGYRVNLESRLASRVLWLIAEGRYRDEDDLYQAARDLYWPDLFGVDRTIKVKVSAQRCPLKSLDFVTLRVKDAVCDRFSTLTRRRPTVDTHRPDLRIDLFLEQERFALYLDTSGEPLFKRGWRQTAGEAPLRENLAAGLLRLAGWTKAEPLLDPMCGAGTILIEAALMAYGVSPGLGRRFAFEKLRRFDATAWRDLCESSRAQQSSRREPLAIHGSDRDERILRGAQANLAAAGLSQSVRLAVADARDVVPPAACGLLLTNPPYGHRLGRESDLAAFYPAFGDALKQRFTGWRACILTADLRLPQLIGLRPSRRTPLFNGALDCRFFEFPLVEGSMRRRRNEKGEQSS